MTTTASTEPATQPTRPSRLRRVFSPASVRVAITAIGAGLLLAASVPPWGWWPLAFVGLVLVDRLVAEQPPAARFRRLWLVTVAWFAPSTLWMADLTGPGYLIASVVVFPVMFGLAGVLCPPGPARRLALPGLFVLTELIRFSWPFGGVPLSNLALGQVTGPLAPVARVGGALLVIGVTVTVAMALAALLDRRWRAAGAAGAVVVLAVGLAAVAPRGSAIGTLDVALVQGGGPQNTRAEDTDPREVFDRHVAATALVRQPVDLVVWPENVVNVDGQLIDAPEYRELQDLARRVDAVLEVGIVEDAGPGQFLNASIVFDREGTEVARYDKVHRVPFGEYVPLRSIVEKLTDPSVLPNDAIPGTEPAILETPVGRLGVVISWEVFFSHRARDAIGHGGTVLLNPTNGSSYWLTQVQTQQIASSRLRAIETGRYVLQAAPTGFSAIVTPDGRVIDRTAVSEQAVVQGTVETRTGETWAVRFGHWPALALSLLVVITAGLWHRRSTPVPYAPRGGLTPRAGA